MNKKNAVLGFAVSSRNKPNEWKNGNPKKIYLKMANQN